jgi:hypothetical protein
MAIKSWGQMQADSREKAEAARQEALAKLSRGEKLSFSEQARVKNEMKAAKAAEREADPAPATPQVQIKRYKGENAFRRDAEKMYAAGWTIVGQSSRKQMYSLMTGVFTRKQISTVTWTKSPAAPGSAPQTVSTADELRKLADLRDADVLSEEEFQAKKADLLAQP